MIEKYKAIEYLVPDIYMECINNGYTPNEALGKIKYELEPMTENDKELALLYFELTYLCVKEKINAGILNHYIKYKKLNNKDTILGFIDKNYFDEKYLKIIKEKEHIIRKHINTKNS